MTNLKIIEQLNLFTESLLKEAGVKAESSGEIFDQIHEQQREMRDKVQLQAAQLAEIFGPPKE
jgi:hypothetical protein